MLSVGLALGEPLPGTSVFWFSAEGFQILPRSFVVAAHFQKSVCEIVMRPMIVGIGFACRQIVRLGFFKTRFSKEGVGEIVFGAKS